MKKYSLKPKEFHRDFNPDLFAAAEVFELEKERFVSESLLRYYLTVFFSVYVTEHAFVFFFSKSKKLLGKMHVQGDGAEYCFPLAGSIEKRGEELKASSFVIAHNHPGTRAEPSREDAALTERLKKYFDGKKLILKDHYVVSGLSAAPMFGGTKD